MTAVVADLQSPEATKTLGRFDLIYSMLAFHHVPDPAKLVHTLATNYLNPHGGRLVILDLEATPNVRQFHPKHMELGVHYEYDGFDETTVLSWLDPADGWSTNSVEVTRVAFDKLTPEDWETNESMDRYSMLFLTATLGDGRQTIENQRQEEALLAR